MGLPRGWAKVHGPAELSQHVEVAAGGRQGRFPQVLTVLQRFSKVVLLAETLSAKELAVLPEAGAGPHLCVFRCALRCKDFQLTSCLMCSVVVLALSLLVGEGTPGPRHSSFTGFLSEASLLLLLDQQGTPAPLLELELTP